MDDDYRNGAGILHLSLLLGNALAHAFLESFRLLCGTNGKLVKMPAHFLFQDFA